jgi:hypothetical protein
MRVCSVRVLGQGNSLVSPMRVAKECAQRALRTSLAMRVMYACGWSGLVWSGARRCVRGNAQALTGA